MQSLDIISVNIWHILISLCNLVLLFLIVKKFLYKPVKATMEKRQSELDTQYDSAAKAQAQAQKNKEDWENKMNSAQETADAMIKDAAKTAELRSETILEQAKERADYIVRQAQTTAELERKNAAAGIRKEIVEVSTQIAGKLLEREVSADDHRQLIDSFIDQIGDDND